MLADQEGHAEEYAAAWAHWDLACAMRRRMQRAWEAAYDGSLVLVDVQVDAYGCGSVDVSADWPEEMLQDLNDTARSFAGELRSCLDEAVAATANCISGSIERPGTGRVCFPIATAEDEFAAAV